MADGERRVVAESGEKRGGEEINKNEESYWMER